MAEFDGANDNLARGGDLTSVSDGKLGILSVWYSPIAGFASTSCLALSCFTAGSGGFYLRLSSSLGADILELAGQDSATNTKILMRSVGTYNTSGAVYHALMSWNTAGASGVQHLYVNDVSDKNVVTLVDGDINYTTGDFMIGADRTTPAAGNRMFGGLAELYFAPGQYLDFSIAANRRRFRLASGKPAHIGLDGALATGVAPAVYLALNDGEAASQFATNRGTGGNFSVTGTLAVSAVSPSD
jgi:hypothetical protein